MNPMRLFTFPMVSVPALVLAAACTSAPAPAPLVPVAAMPPPPTMVPVAPAATAKRDTLTPTSSSVHIDERIRAACGDIPTAHFAFDSSAVEPEAAGALDALARCFTTGPLRGRSMKLIGHADARGETEYNFGLGQRRAGNVAGYLTARGVDRSRVSPSSHVALDATGVDEEGWARDRKVDVLLAE